MTTTVVGTDTAARLWRLYLVRFVFAAAWAAAVAAVGGSLGAAAVTLLVAYPVVDVAAAVVDLRLTGNRLLLVNIVVSTLAAAGTAVAAADDIGSVLRVFGVWAIVAGLVQLAVAIRRRAVGGQWPMTLSGSISVLAGAGFVRQAAHADSVRTLAGYATLGGIFFLASALWLRHTAARNASAEVR